MRAYCDEKVSTDSRGDDESSRGEDEMVVAMTGHKKADAGWKRGEGREEESYLVNLFALFVPNSAKLYGGGEVVFPRPPKFNLSDGENTELLNHSI